MKKTQMGRTVWAAALLVCCIALFTTCKNTVGLGGTVDINPPTVDLATVYPPVGSIIKDDFILSVVADDDTKVKSVTATIVNADSNEQLGGTNGFFNLKVAADGKRWSATLNTKGETGYTIPDGTYKATLLVTDNSGKDVRVETTFTIDNTPPLLILNRPSTTTLDDSADVFGDGFLLVGQVYDETAVAELTITAKGQNADSPSISKTLKNIPQNIRITVDSFTDDEKSKLFYCGLYGDKREDVKKSYEYDIVVTDDAKEYKKPGDAGAGTGNTTANYYLYNALYDKVLKDHKIQAVYAMLRGTYTSKPSGTRSAEDIRQDDKTAANVREELQNNQLGGTGENAKKGTFALNPSLNPQFAVVGENPVARLERSSPEFSPVYSGNALKVKLSCNLDEVPLEGQDTYGFFLMEWSAFAAKAQDQTYPTAFINGTGEHSIYESDGTTVKSGLGLIEIKQGNIIKKEQEGSNYLFSLRISEALGISYGKKYVLLVRGKDKNGNELIPDLKGIDKGVYGFYFVKNEKLPEVYVTVIKGTVSGHETPGIGTAPTVNVTDRAYLKGGDSMNFTVYLTQQAKLLYTLKKAGGAVAVPETAKPDTAAGATDITIPADKFDSNGGNYQLSVWAEGTGGKSVEQTYHIVYDARIPEIVIESPIDNEKRNEDNKKLTISGTAFDSGIGLKNNPVTLQLTKTKGPNLFQDRAVVLQENGASWNTAELDFSATGYGEGTYRLTVTAEDLFGYTSSKEHTFFYDVADPKLTGLKINGELIADDVDGVTVYTTNGATATVEGTVEETNGLKSFTINGTDAGTLNSGAFPVVTITPALATGNNPVKIKLVDNADKTFIKTVNVVVDNTVPVFNEIEVGGRLPAYNAGSDVALGGAPAVISTSINPVHFKGKVTDMAAGSGIQQVTYTLDDPSSATAEWKQITLKYISSSESLFDGYISIPVLGSNQKVTLRVTDRAGNRTDWTRDIKVVSSIPDIVLSLNPITGITDGPIPNRRGAFSITMGAYLSDADGTETADVTVTKKIGTNPETNVPLASFFAGTWSPLRITDGNASPRLVTVVTTKDGLDSGLYTIRVTANNIPRELRFRIDNTKPVIEFKYPNKDAPQAGKVTVQGIISDLNDGSGVKASETKYLIAKTNTIPLGGPTVDTAGWERMGASTDNSWSFTHDFATITSATANEWGTVREGTDNAYYDIPVYILGKDVLGNTNIEKGSILLNPDGLKPVVTVLAPTGGTVGGTIQIFGTSSVAIGTPADIGKAYIQFSKTGTFNQTDCTINGVDWYGADGKGIVIPDTGTKGAMQWTQTINGDKKFDNPSGDSWKIYFRVRAENKTQAGESPDGHLFGAWSKTTEITIDKSAPKIGSPDALKVKVTTAADNTAVNFTPNMWIKDEMTLIGSLYDEAGIKEVTISGDLENGRPYNLEQAKTVGWIVEDTANAPTSSTTAKNYKLKIPLALNNLSATAKVNNAFKVKIEVVEATNQNLRSTQELQFRFDTTNPFGDFGDSKYVGNGTFTTSAITDSILAGAITSLTDSGASLTDLGILAGNHKLTINSVSGNTVNFTVAGSASGVPAFTAGLHNYILYQQKTLIYNDNGSWMLRGVANDDGSGVKEVKAKVEVGSTSKEQTMTETDNRHKISKQLGGQVTWNAPIDLSSLNDGKGTLTYTIIDNSGNEYTASIPVQVKNKPIKVTKLTFKTKVGGEEVITDQSTAKPEKTDQPEGTEDPKTRDYTKTVTSRNFAFKDKTYSKIKVEFTGGERDTDGKVHYQLFKADGTTKIGSEGTIANTEEIDLTALFGSGANEIPNSNGTPSTIILKLWDSAEGLTTGSAGAYATVTITTLFEALDTKKPTVVILPFYWNDEGKDVKGNPNNSLYDGDRDNGHVEIGAVTGLGSASSLSGKVNITGFAYDNTELKEIVATVPNSTALTVTATRKTDGTWESDKKMAANGAELVVTTLGTDYLGHYVAWRLDWNTENTTVGTEKEIIVKATDGSSNTSEVPATGTAGTDMPAASDNMEQTATRKKAADASVIVSNYATVPTALPDSVNLGQFAVLTGEETQYLVRITDISQDRKTVTFDKDIPVAATKVAVYKYTANKTKTAVNVMPYISNVETGLTGIDGSYKGAFSRASTGEYPVRAGETITVKGFNLAGGEVFLGSTSLGTNLNSVSIALSHTSGELSVKVGSIEAINNKVNVSKPYNIEANNMNNDVLTAKRKLFVWKMTPIINNNFMESPQFVMDSKSNYYMSYGSLAGTNMSFNMMKNGTVDHTATQMKNNYVIEQCFSKYHNTVVAFDDDENMYGGATNTDRAGGSTSFTFFSREQGSGALGTNGNYAGGTNRRRLENSNNIGRGVYDVNRVQIPKLAVRGPASDAKVVLIYYDRNNNALPIKFRYGSVTAPDSISNGLSHNVSSNGGSSDPNNSGSAQGYEVIADNANTTVYKSGGYAAVALTSTGRAVAVWYDSVNSRLVYSYRDVSSYTEPAAGVTDRKIAEWQGNAVVVDTGSPLYVDVAIDDEDGLHIGYYSSGEGGVKYAYLPPNKVTGTTKPSSTDFKVVKVDTYMNPGTLLKIGVRKESTKQVPYISYYHNGFYGSKNAARMAWLKDGLVKTDAAVKDGMVNNKFTGDWVVMTVPASNGIQQYTICQGVPTSGGYADKVIAAYFTNKNYEMAVLSKN